MFYGLKSLHYFFSNLFSDSMKTDEFVVAHVCDECDQSFPTPSMLKRHVDGVHEKIRHKCDSCNASYTQKNNLNQHIKKKHLK